jgi:tetratricopeptide (TPR) repeat protein
VPEAIQAMATAPFRGYLTSGFDGLLAGALSSRPELTGRMVFAADTATLESARGPFLIQLLGRSDMPASIILSPSELASKVMGTGAGKYLETIHRKWSFVFIGFGPNDPDLVLLAGRLLGNHPGHMPHFFVAPGLSSLDAKRVRSQFGLSPVPVEGDLAAALGLLAEVANRVPETPASDDVEGWMQRLTADPDSTTAAAAVAQGLSTLRERHEWDRLVGLLIERTEVWPDPVLQAADLRAAGLILDQELHAADRAYPALMTALRLRPHDAELLADARRMAVNAGLETEFLREMRAIEQEASRADNSHAIALGLGRLYADDPERRDEAVSAFRKVLERDPKNTEARAALETLFQTTDRLADLRALYEATLAREEDNAEIAGKLEALYERTEQTGPFVAWLEKRVAKSPDDGAAFD